MIQEAYCNFEISNLLKKKGFDELCSKKYDCYKNIVPAGKMIELWQNSEFDVDEECSAPTHQMAMAWLREKNIFIEIHASRTEKNFYRYTIIHTPVSLDDIQSTPEYFYTYEDAVEAALKYTLESLI